jgi:putative transcriptional regulator
MAKMKPPRSRLLEAVHESARDLHRVGWIDARRLRTFDALCALEVPSLSAAQIKRLRGKLHVSQAVLAAVLNTSVSTVQKWEIGEKRPGGTAMKLLHLIERKGLDAVL